MIRLSNTLPGHWLGSLKDPSSSLGYRETAKFCSVPEYQEQGRLFSLQLLSIICTSILRQMQTASLSLGLISASKHEHRKLHKMF
jgi:hypothetical protein